MSRSVSRRHRMPAAMLHAAIALCFIAAADRLQSQTGDRRVPSGDAAVPSALAQAAQAVGFLDAGPPEPGSAPDGGSAILISDCLALTANHVVEALASGKKAVMLRLRFPTLTDEKGGMRSFAATVEARPSGLWRDPVSDDWALLRLAEAPGLPPLEPAPATCCGWQTLPVPAAVAGFPADRFDAAAPVLWIDPACSIQRRLALPVLATDCQATSGNSGGPVLVQSGGGWKLAGMLTRAPPPKRRGLKAGQTTYALVIDGRMASAIRRAKERPCAASPPGPAPVPRKPGP